MPHPRNLWTHPFLLSFTSIHVQTSTSTAKARYTQANHGVGCQKAMTVQTSSATSGKHRSNCNPLHIAKYTPYDYMLCVRCLLGCWLARVCWNMRGLKNQSLQQCVCRSQRPGFWRCGFAARFLAEEPRWGEAAGRRTAGLSCCHAHPQSPWAPWLLPFPAPGGRSGQGRRRNFLQEQQWC